jgi:amidohydrolase
MNKELIAFRHDLHRNPELSGCEIRTQKSIQSFLSKFGATSPRKVGNTGLLYSFTFGNGPHILVRVDIDALPILELNEFEYKSELDGVSHMCGHDGHTTIGAGLIAKLLKSPLEGGSVDVLFQPAEENGEGAKAVIDDANFHLSSYDYAIALHNIPGAPMHQVLWKKGSFTPAVQSLIIRLYGKSSHAAQPLKGINPAYAIGEMLHMAKTLEVIDERHPDYALITPICANFGDRDYGIAPGYGEVHFTIRSWEQSKMVRITEVFTNLSKTIATSNNLGIETELTAVFASNQNDSFVSDSIKNAAKKLHLDIKECGRPFPWGEDFGLFTQHIPGAMFGLGAGLDTPALHNPDYDFPDEIIATGVNIFYTTLEEIIFNQ